LTRPLVSNPLQIGRSLPRNFSSVEQLKPPSPEGADTTTGKKLVEQAECLHLLAEKIKPNPRKRNAARAAANEAIDRYERALIFIKGSYVILPVI